MIYCVEDDGSARELMMYTLKTAGFEAAGFERGEALFHALQRERPRLILLDIMLPGEDGISILRKLRLGEETAKIPVIMTTARGTEYDKVTGLDLGADDYLVKPFGMMEMISRIRAVLRRTDTGEADGTMQMGSLELHPQAGIVLVAGTRVRLTLKEYKLLCTFMKNPGRVFTRDQLLTMVWGMNYMGESRTVDVHIGTLRTKLGACGGYIETVRGMGYRLEKKI